MSITKEVRVAGKLPNESVLHFGDLLTLGKSTPCAVIAQGARTDSRARDSAEVSGSFPYTYGGKRAIRRGITLDKSPSLH
jgi:hypothetical protein